MLQKVQAWICGKPFTARSSRWPRVRDEHLLKNPTCEACGSGKNLIAHHVKPVHLFPELELDPENLLTLCESKARNCHLVFGHLLHWASYNVDARQDSEAYRIKVFCRPMKGKP